MIALALFWVLLPPYPLESMIDVLGMNHHHTSKLEGMLTRIETGVILIGRGSPGEGLRVYNTTRSAILSPIVWKHGHALTSVA